MAINAFIDVLGFVIRSAGSTSPFDHLLSSAVGAIIALVAGVAAYLLREVIFWKLYPFIEILLGMVAGSFFVREGETFLTRIILLFAGVRIIVDGIKRILAWQDANSVSQS